MKTAVTWPLKADSGWSVHASINFLSNTTDHDGTLHVPYSRHSLLSNHDESSNAAKRNSLGCCSRPDLAAVSAKSCSSSASTVADLDSCKYQMGGMLLAWTPCCARPQAAHEFVMKFTCVNLPQEKMWPKLTDITYSIWVFSRFFWHEYRFAGNFLLVKKNKSWGVFCLILDQCPRAKCIKYIPRKVRFHLSTKKYSTYISATEKKGINMPIPVPFTGNYTLYSVCHLKNEMHGSSVFCQRRKMDLLRLICQNQH